MLEILQHVTTNWPVFIGCTSFVCGTILCTGWALNAIIIGFKGIKADHHEF